MSCKRATRALITRELVIAATTCIVFASALIILIGPDKILEARLLNASFIRQMNGAFLLASDPKINQIFSQWNTLGSHADFAAGPIHLTYTTITNISNSLIAFMSGGERAYSNITLAVSTVIAGISGSILLLSTKKEDSPQESGKSVAFGYCASAIYLTNPAHLASFIEPDVEDAFLLLSFLGYYLWQKEFKRLAYALFAIASFAYPLGAGILCATSCIYKAVCSKRIQNLARLKGWLPIRLPLNDAISIKPFVVGIASWLIARMTYVLTAPEGTVYSGGTLIKRAGLDIADSYYGGVLGAFRFLIPLSGIPANLKEAVGTYSLTEAWGVLNYIQIAVTFTGLSAFALLYGLSELLKKSRPGSSNNYSVSRYFLVLTIGIAIILPQWSSVHFRLLARFFAPAMSFYLAHFLVRVGSKLPDKTGVRQLALIISTSLICTEQLHFFGKWMLGTQ